MDVESFVAATEAARNLTGLRANLRQEMATCRAISRGEVPLTPQQESALAGLTPEQRAAWFERKARERFDETCVAMGKRIAWFEDLDPAAKTAIRASLVAFGVTDFDAYASATKAAVTNALAAKKSTKAEMQTLHDAVMASVPRPLRVEFRDSVP